MTMSLLSALLKLLLTLSISNYVKSSCLFKMGQVTSFTGVNSDSQAKVISLEEYDGNKDFTFNFRIKHNPLVYTAESITKYYIADIDGMITIFIKYYGGVPRLFIRNIAGVIIQEHDFELSTMDMYITIMRSQGVNWKYSVFKTSDVTSTEIDLPTFTPSSFRKESKLWIGRNFEEGSHSFGGEIGPYTFDNNDHYDRDPMSYNTLFQKGQIKQVFMLIPKLADPTHNFIKDLNFLNFNQEILYKLTAPPNSQLRKNSKFYSVGPEGKELTLQPITQTGILPTFDLNKIATVGVISATFTQKVLIKTPSTSGIMEEIFSFHMYGKRFSIHIGVYNPLTFSCDLIFDLFGANFKIDTVTPVTPNFIIVFIQIYQAAGKYSINFSYNDSRKPSVVGTLSSLPASTLTTAVDQYSTTIGNPTMTTDLVIVDHFIFEGTLDTYKQGECTEGDNDCQFATTNSMTLGEVCLSCQETYYVDENNWEQLSCSSKPKIEFDNEHFYKALSQDNIPYEVKCPSEKFGSSIPCPIPECEEGYEAHPYYCKYAKEFTPEITKFEGLEVTINLPDNQDFNLEKDVTLKISILDRYSDNPIDIEELILESTVHSSDIKEYNLKVRTDYCFDLKIVLDFYDSDSETQKAVIYSQTITYRLDEYCGLDETKRKQEFYSAIVYYMIMAGPLLALVLPSIISKFQVLNTMTIFILFPFELPLSFKMRFKLFCDLNTDDFLSSAIKTWQNISDSKNMTQFANREFNFQAIFSSKMLFQCIQLDIYILLVMLLIKRNVIKSEKVKNFVKGQFLNHGIVLFTRFLIYFIVCINNPYSTADLAIMGAHLIIFSVQQFYLLDLYSENRQKQSFGLQLQMHSMSENYFGIALLLIFSLTKNYFILFWVAIFAHSVVKIFYNGFKIIHERRKFIQVVNVLIVLGETSRYILYMVMHLWVKETKRNQINQDLEYGDYMFNLLLFELLFHLLGMVLTIIHDIKEYCRMRKLSKLNNGTNLNYVKIDHRRQTVRIDSPLQTIGKRRRQGTKLRLNLLKGGVEKPKKQNLKAALRTPGRKRRDRTRPSKISNGSGESNLRKFISSPKKMIISPSNQNRRLRRRSMRDRMVKPHFGNYSEFEDQKAKTPSLKPRKLVENENLSTNKKENKALLNKNEFRF